VSECSTCQDRRLVGGFLPAPCPTCAGGVSIESHNQLRADRDRLASSSAEWMRQLAESRAEVMDLSTKLAAVEAERDVALKRLGKMDSGASMPLAAALRNATQGTVHIQDDGALPGDRHNVYRIVLDEDARRFREDYESTARPPYLATVYSKENAELYRVAHNVLPRLIEHHRSALAEVEALRGESERMRLERDALGECAETFQRERDEVLAYHDSNEIEYRKLTTRLRSELADMEFERDTYRSMLADLHAAAFKAHGYANEWDEILTRSRQLLKHGPRGVSPRPTSRKRGSG
jgi:hypothetical protein